MSLVTGPARLLEEIFGLSIWEISAPLAGMKFEKHNQMVLEHKLVWLSTVVALWTVVHVTLLIKHTP